MLPTEAMLITLVVVVWPSTLKVEAVIAGMVAAARASKLLELSGVPRGLRVRVVNEPVMG